jgi:hypothetical protein
VENIPDFFVGNENYFMITKKTAKRAMESEKHCLQDRKIGEVEYILYNIGSLQISRKLPCWYQKK